MADKINFNPDTYEGEIPEYAKEATQAKILAALAKQFNMDKKQLEQAKKQFEADKQNAAALGDDLDNLTTAQRLLADRIYENSRKSGGSLMGKLGNPLVMFTKAVATAGAGVAALGVGAFAAAAKLSYSAAEFSFGLGRDLQKLNDTSLLFQDGLDDSLSSFNRLGVSTDMAIGAMGNYSMLTTQLGAKSLPGLINTFNSMSSSGVKFGRNMAENAELLMEQADAQVRLGLFATMDDYRRAESVDAIVTAQLEASKVLGKSMRDLRQETSSTLETSLAAQRILNQFTDGSMGEALTIFTDSLAGMNLGESVKQGLLANLGGFGIADTPEAGNTLAFLNNMGQEGRKAVDALEEFKKAQTLGDEEKMADTLAEFQKNLKSVFGMEASKKQIDMLYAMANAGNQVADEFLKLNRQIRAGTKATKDNGNDLSDIVKAAAKYDNIVLGVSGMYESLQTQFRGATALILGPLLDSFGEVSDENSALGKISAATGKAFVNIFNSIKKLLLPSLEVGTDGLFDLGEFADEASKFIEDMGISIGEWVKGLKKFKGDNFMESITNAVNAGISTLMNVIGSAIADAWSKVDLWDLMFGDDDEELVKQAKQRAERTSRGAATDEQKSTKLMNAISDIVDTSTDKEYKPQKMLKLIADAGVDITKLTGEHLLELFPDPQDLKDAISSVYKDKDPDAALLRASDKIMQYADAQAKDIRKGPGSYLKKDVLINEQAGVFTAISEAFKKVQPSVVTDQREPDTTQDTKQDKITETEPLVPQDTKQDKITETEPQDTKQDKITEIKPVVQATINLPETLIDAPINRRGRPSKYSRYRSSTEKQAVTTEPEVAKITPPSNPITNKLNSTSLANTTDSSSEKDDNNKQNGQLDQQNKQTPFNNHEKTFADVVESQNAMSDRLTNALADVTRAVNSSGRKIEKAAS
jgi:hypothetical protein